MGNNNSKLTAAQVKLLETYHATEQTKTHERLYRENGTRKQCKHYLQICTPRNMGADGQPSITETGWTYMYAAAAKIAYQAVKTAYQRSAQPFLYDMMCAASFDFRRLAASEYQQTDIHGALMHQVKRKRRKGGIWVETLELELTDVGACQLDKAWVDVSASDSADFSDLIQDAFTALWQVHKKGLMWDFSSVWTFKKVAYNAVTNRIKWMRSRRAETRDSTRKTTVTQNGELVERVYMGAAMPRTFSGLPSSIIVDIAWDAIAAQLSPCANFERMRRAFNLHFIGGYTQAEIASIIGVAQQQVSKYLRSINNAIALVKFQGETPEIYQIASDYITACR